MMPGTTARSSAVVVPHTPAWRQRAGARIVYAFLRAVALTLRYQWNDRSGLFEDGPAGPAIYCVWHNRLALCMFTYSGYLKRRNSSSGLAVMVSASRDGGFLTGILECFGVQPVRGSTSRRGHQALRELTTWARRNHDLAITPDGPRGPRYVVQDGIIALAQLTGMPIVPVSCNVGWKIQLKNWDRFQVPMPFSSCAMEFGKPVRVPRNVTEAGREQCRLELERGLHAITRD